jgi:hypothetical protein
MSIKKSVVNIKGKKKGFIFNFDF